MLLNMPSIVNARKGKGRYQMASKRSGSRAKSGGEGNTGKRRTKKESLKDLEAKDSQKISGGVTYTPITIKKPIDSSTP